MKKILKVSTISTLSLIVVLYVAFLLMPFLINLNNFMPEIKKITKEQIGLNIEVTNPKLIATANLQAGLKTDRILVKLPDNSVLFEADSFKTRLSLPQLLGLTVKITCLEVNSPQINLDIANGEQFKIIKLVEDFLNKQKDLPKQPTEDENAFKFNPAWIKIKVPKLVIKDYKIAINDLKTNHSLSLLGEKLIAGYNNGKTARINTVASVMSDDSTNIVANINISTFLPPAQPADPEDDPAEKIEIPFVNPVLMYRDYDLKSSINTKLRIRQNKEGSLLVRGFLNIDDTTMNLAGYQLPNCYLHTKFNGTTAKTDTNIYVAKDQYINLLGKIGFGKRPFVDINVITSKIYFNDLIILAKAFLDTLHINNDFASLKGNGYWESDAYIKTNFKKIKSSGKIIAKDGSIANGKTKLVFDNINAHIGLDNSTIDIKDTGMLINGNPLNITGQIAQDSYVDIKINSDKLPLAGLFMAFAPADLKKSFILSNGNLSLNSEIQGKLQSPVISTKVNLKDFVFKDKANSFAINNDSLIAGVVTDLKTLHGDIANKNFSFIIPATSSNIELSSLDIKFNEQNININPFDLVLNKSSKIQINGQITEYTTNPIIDITADGNLNAVGIRQFAGTAAEPFILAKGNLPIKASISGTDKRQEIVLQIKSDNQNYITPIDIDITKDKNSILQAKIGYKGDKLHIRKTGIYTNSTQFGDDLAENLNGTEKVVDVFGTIVNLNTPQPFINMINISFAKNLKAKLSAFPKSSLTTNSHIIVFGKLASPLMKGYFSIEDLKLPELLIALKKLDINLIGKNILVKVDNLLLNGSDINIGVKTDIIPRKDFTISKLDVTSNSIDLDRMLEITKRLEKYTVAPQTANTTNAQTDIPVEIKPSNINLKKIKTGGIVAYNTTGKISLKDNNFYLNNLRTQAFDGTISGNVIANIVTMALQIKTEGHKLNADKTMIGVANLKDTLSGDIDFTTDISLEGTTLEEQMKSLKGNVDFSVKDGQLGPFGKLENMIIAENIRESKFFQTALGGVINSLTTIDTTHFSLIDGHLSFNDGVVSIDPISTLGNVMCLNIFGEMNLLENTIEMKVRGKLASVISNLLGPIAQLNPINLVQVTPGLNVIMAQAFALFCEEITQAELNAIPNLQGDSADNLATKFQLVLRGDVAKPLSLLKSFKWLALSTEMQQAQGFVSSLPDPSIMGDTTSATVEEIIKAQELKAIEDAKLKNKIIRFFKREQ